MKKLSVFLLLMELIVLTKCISFDCTFQTASWITVGSVYTCVVMKVTMPNGVTVLTVVTGTHQDGKSNKDVETLFLQDNCPFIPSGIEQFFPKLLVIIFQYANLQTVSSDDLKPFPLLKYFASNSNPIEIIDGNLFDNNSNLERVSFYYNNLTHVGHNLLDNLSKLNEAVFDGNLCINVRASTPAAIIELKSKLVQQCPPLQTTKPVTTTEPTSLEPSCELTEAIETCEPELSYLIDKQIADRINELVLKVYTMDEQLITKSEQIDSLEQQLQAKEVRVDELEVQLTETRAELTETNMKLDKAIQQIEEIMNNLEQLGDDKM